ncbi:PWWP-like protein [Artemisia annua]|uniref:PWWP-like protein n=1 Tax=Artemisia annua TaxID=35608 RepID=A0A2U1NAI9_ARTAN|nr:PWWP-like protein [Artemisia annua]
MEFESEVGTIVWVRRRNGSWWPGKILGGEELSASHLMSPRSGTPVKLLGREDASVKRPRHDDDVKEEESINKRRLNTSPKLPPNPMPLQTHPPLLLVEVDNKTPVAHPPEMAAAAASGDSSDHTPDHLLQGEKRKPSPEDQSMQLQLDHKEHPKSDESFDYNPTPLSDWVDVSTPKSQNAFTVTVSKWQLKGKRNTRSLMKRYRNAAGDNKLLVGSSQWMNYRGGEDRLAADSFDKRLRSQAIGFNMPTRDVGLDSSHDIINSVEGYWEQQPTDYHDSSLAYMNSLQFGGRMKSMLIDVDVQVQSGYQREHVPMISLMSKLNDNAIVGHPIPVETIQDGSSDIILSAAETYEYQTESLALDPDDTALQPWRTARRTAKCRVPRPPAQDEYAAADEERKHNNRKGGSISRKWPSPKLQKKPQRRSVLSHSQKIRTLSSIGGGGDQISDLRAEDGVMKPAAAAVACIPVKLVFSRLHEELSVRSVPKGGKCFGERNCKEETAEMLKILKTSLWRMNVHHLVLESK